MRRFVLLAITFLMLSPSSLLIAGKLKGVTLPDSITIDGQDLVLNGMALRKKFVFKVYVAGLYLPQKEKDGKKIFAGDQPRRTVMHFLRSVGTKKLNNAWYEGLEANTPGHSQALKKQFDTMCSWMEDVKENDRIIFTYMNGKGTKITVKGKVKGSLEGKAFADAIFACWIGAKPGPGNGFKEDLLGK